MIRFIGLDGREFYRMEFDEEVSRSQFVMREGRLFRNTDSFEGNLYGCDGRLDFAEVSFLDLGPKFSMFKF